jgi:hypothetical protein
MISMCQRRPRPSAACSFDAGLGKTSTAKASGDGEPGEPDKPAGSVAPTPKKPAPERKAEPAGPTSKEAQIRALREQGAR